MRTSVHPYMRTLVHPPNTFTLSHAIPVYKCRKGENRSNSHALDSILD